MKFSLRLGASTLALATLLTSSACVTRRAADILTIPRRATDGAHWEKETKLKPERFEVTAQDGITLSAYTLPPSPGVEKRGTAWLLHGFGNSKEQMLPVAKKLSAAGFRCVAWDSRGHGKSGGERVTYGNREADDALRVMKTAREMPGHIRGPEVIWAYSLGTAVALQALPEMPRAKAAVLLAPSDLNGVVYHQAGQRYSGALRPFVPIVRSNVRKAAGFDFRAIRPVDSVKKTSCKMLFIHGDRDGTIPPWQSKALLDACKPGQGERILLPNGHHGTPMWDLPEETGDQAIEFLIKNSRK